MKEAVSSGIHDHFACLVRRISGSEYAVAAACLSSRALEEGNICIKLSEYAGKDIEGIGKFPGIDEWKSGLLSSGIAGNPGETAPLVLDDSGRLYLMRYFMYERSLAEKIKFLSARRKDFDAERLRKGLARLFPKTADGPDWQKIACIPAVTGGFCVVSGGPGTGKTTTAAKLIVLLLEQDASLRIALAAPTGKAAKRLGEAVRDAIIGFDCSDEVKKAVPARAVTLHRLLGIGSDSSRIRFDEANPLQADVVIVDEASMVSLPLMSRLTAALRDDARLILLGDRNQLSSVEAGYVLGDICDTGSSHDYSINFTMLVRELAGYDLLQGKQTLQDSIVELRENYRFSQDSGIGMISASIREGSFSSDIFKHDSGVVLRPMPAPAEIRHVLEKVVVERFTPYIREKDIGEKLRLFNSFRILCALRRGPYGVEGINSAVEKALSSAGLINPRGKYYDMMPLMITANDYSLGLFNGDTGIVAQSPDGALYAWFDGMPGDGDKMRRIPVARLPENVPVYAMTIHKSQGSEFENVLMILPDRDSQVLTRELVYTGVTRARKTLWIWAEQDVLKVACSRRIARRSGLRDALWLMSNA